MYPDAWNNRQISWQFIQAPNYTGDIQIGFLQGANAYWSAISITHLANGIHGIQYYQNGTWINAPMDSDMGDDYVILPTITAGTSYQIRVYDASNQLINNGRIYHFTYPTSCGTSCSAFYLPITYTTS
jgi:expansin (peptidoglycan-binding protein)